MCKTQCVLALMALYVGVALSWDIAVSDGDVIEFYTNGTKTDTVRFKSHNLTALAYDEVHDMMLYVDKRTHNETICGYDLSTTDVTCFVERSGSNIHSLAFDPATEILFFTDTNNKSINWISLKTYSPGSRNVVYGNLLLKMTDRTPTDIAVESYNGYVYWINTYDTDISTKETMERARLNGSEREVLYKSFSLDIYTLAIDQESKKIYYFDGFKTDLNFYNNADFNGQNVISDYLDVISEQKELTASKDYIYWMDSNEDYQTVWQLPKYTTGFEPKAIKQFNNDKRIGIASNYKMKEQIQGTHVCEALTRLAPNNSDGLFCVHGMRVSGQSVCTCAPGYTGERCDVSVCENYCLQGNCSFKDDGLPKCSCNAGYSGERCEVNVCFNYCLNDGNCSLDEEDTPVCQCVGKHQGSRCEAVNNTTYIFTNTTTNYSAERNLTLVDLLSNWRKSTKITVTVEVK